MRTARRWAWIAATVAAGGPGWAATGCRFPTSGGPAPVALVGQWDYAGTQTTPSPATLVGTLTISAQGGSMFQGSLAVTQRDALGNVTSLSGVVSGQLVDTTAVSFDAFLAVTARHHLGALRHDSISGSWVEQTTAGVTSAGSFTAVLQAAP